MATALSHPAGALILFDFAAAFPSISQRFMVDLLQKLGIPTCALNLFKAFYNNNRCQVQVNGHEGGGFKMTSGVRQGCPLSPLLFALCADLLLERIRSCVPSAVVRAYADDTAVVVQDLWRDAPLLPKIFEEFASLANLDLNIGKTVIVPLFPSPALDAVKAQLQAELPAWRQVQILYCGKYLGFQVGPSAGESCWNEATAKYKQRATAWADHLRGLHCSALTYNTFAIPVLSYLAQLRTPPATVLAEELRTLARAAPGPYRWATSSDLWHLTSITGHPKSFKSLALLAKASQLRARMWDPACDDSVGDPGTILEPHHSRSILIVRPSRHDPSQGRPPNRLGSHSTFYARYRMLIDLLNGPEQPYTRAVWKDWFADSIVITLHNTLQESQGLLQTLESPSMRSPNLTVVRKTFQKKVYSALLAANAPNTESRI